MTITQVFYNIDIQSNILSFLKPLNIEHSNWLTCTTYFSNSSHLEWRGQLSRLKGTTE
jgi:hypothetical protein